MDEVEKQVDYLDAAERKRHANLPASKTDLGKLWEKLEDMENWSRRNNVCLFGIPEGKEGRDAVKFLDKLIPKLLETQGKRETECTCTESPVSSPDLKINQDHLWQGS